MTDKDKLTGTITDMVQTGWKYLESQGWRIYRDDVVPPEDEKGRFIADETDAEFKKLIDYLQSLRFELNDDGKIPF